MDGEKVNTDGLNRHRLAAAKSHPHNRPSNRKNDHALHNEQGYSGYGDCSDRFRLLGNIVDQRLG